MTIQTDDFQLSPQAALSAAIARELIGATACGERSPKGTEVVARLRKVIAAHVDILTSETQARHDDMAVTCGAYFDALNASDASHAAGDEVQTKAHWKEVHRLQAKLSEIHTYRTFPDAAVALHQAKDFETFCAVLPSVALDQTYGRTYGKVSQFPLIWAMSARDRPLERVQMMLRLGARTDLKATGWQTVLHEMAASKRTAKIRLPILRALVFHGADLEARDVWSATPLTVALNEGSRADVGYFLAAGAKVELQHLQAAAYDPENFATLMDHIAGNACEADYVTQLGPWLRDEIAFCQECLEDNIRRRAGLSIEEARIKHLGAALQTIENHPLYVPPVQTGKLTWTQEPAAFKAVKLAKTMDAFRAALDGVDMATYPDTENDQPIYWPLEADENRAEKLWLLLSAGASVTGGPNGTALHILAAQSAKKDAGQDRLLTMLLQHGAQLEAKDYANCTPLYYTLSGQNSVGLDAFLAAGADPDADAPRSPLRARSDTMPLLFHAAERAHKFKRLLDAGADTTRQAADGQALIDYLRAALITEERALRSGHMSGNLRKHVTRLVNNYSKALALLS